MVRCTKCHEMIEYENTYGRGRYRVCKPCARSEYRNRYWGRKLEGVPIPDSKICSSCRAEKGSEFFNFNPLNSDGLDTYCMDCKKQYRSGSEENPGYGKLHEAEVKNLRRELKSVPCADCGVMYPYYVMQFHHVDPEQKSVQMSTITSKKQLLRESEKCVVLCANCHLEREWGENGSSRNRRKK